MSRMSCTLVLFAIVATPLTLAVVGCGDDDGGPPENVVDFASNDIECTDVAGDPLSDTLTVDLVASCAYYRDSDTVTLSVQGGPLSAPTGRISVQVVGMTGPGSYDTGLLSDDTYVDVISDQSTCYGHSWDDSGDCDFPTVPICTITVVDTDLHEMTLSDSGSLPGMIQLDVVCDPLYHTCGGAGGMTSLYATIPSFALSVDVYDCEAGH